MSRIGKKKIAVPDGVKVALDNRTVVATGSKGELHFDFDEDVIVTLDDGFVSVMPRDQSKKSFSKWGMSRTMIANIINGVKNGFEKKLEINGVGYRAVMQGKNLQLQLGFSHEVIYKPIDGISILCSKPTEIIVSGIDKQKVGQVAAEIKSYRPCEPYKGKGIRYAGEMVFRKEGKKK